MRGFSRCAAAAALVLGGVALAEDKKLDAKPVTDAEFVIMAASGGMFEVESSKVARDGAASADVKKFAGRMIADHGKANKELVEVAKKANLGVPTKMLDDHQKLLDRVKGAKGSDLDRVYMDAQVTAHEEAVALFSSAAKSAQDPGVKAFAEKTLPVIKEHYEHAKKHAKGK
jgi:putative membrane protein